MLSPVVWLPFDVTPDSFTVTVSTDPVASETVTELDPDALYPEMLMGPPL
jgi:hypothetical protein